MEPDAADILKYYGAGGEEQRLTRGIGQLELARTQEILAGQLPRVPAVVYDIGGGTGIYAFWLAGLGYEVHLFDLTPENISRARELAESRREPQLAGIEVGDARQIDRPDGSADAVLLMGPLYHLTERAGRMAALRESWRLLKPGGILAAAAITRFGSMLWGLSTYGSSNWMFDEEAFRQMVARELEDGQHIRPADLPGLFTRAFFHLPGDLSGEVLEAGFCQVSLFAVEGPGWIVPQFEEIWADERRREVIIRALRVVGNELSLMGMSPHFLAVGRKGW